MAQWNRNLYVLVAAIFLIMVGWTSFLPFLPHFIREELGIRSTAAVEMWTGIIIALAPLAIALTSPYWGTRADRTGHKGLLLQSIISLSVATTLMGLSRNVWQLAAVRLVTGIFAGFVPAGVGFIGRYAPPQTIGYALGMFQMAQMTGTIFGPVIGGWIVGYVGYRAAFLAGSAFCFAALPLVALGVREPRRPMVKAAPGSPGGDGLRETLAWVRERPQFLAIFVSILVSQLSLRGLEPMTPLYVEELAGTADTSMLTGIVYGSAGVGTLIASPLLGRLGDRWNHLPVLEGSLVIACLASVGQFMAGDPWMLAAWRTLLGVGIGGILPATNALAGQLAPEGRKGGAYGVINSATFLGNAGGPVVGSSVAAWLGVRSIFGLAAGLLLANAAWVASSLGGHHHKGEMNDG